MGTGLTIPFCLFISEWKFNLDKKRGIALLVTCDYKGTRDLPPLPETDKDAMEMKMTFEQFNYDIKQLKKATEPEVITLVKQLSKYLKGYNGAIYNPDGEIKAIIFAFSGHGTNENLVLANDGEPLFLRDIVELLVVNYRGDTCDKIPKLFFIDACRGKRVIKAKGKLDVNNIEGNFCIEYATIHDHKAFADGDESAWMPVLARELRQTTDTYQNVMAIVNQKVNKQGIHQQPQAQSQLTCGPLRLYYKRKETSYRQVIKWHVLYLEMIQMGYPYMNH